MPKRKRTTPSATLQDLPPPIPAEPSEAALAAATADVLALSELPPELSPRRKSTRKRVRHADTDVDVGRADAQDGGEESPEKEKPRRRRRKKEKEPVVYDIPPVERKQTAFTGRLGYACLNTLLRVNTPESIFCSRTCRLDTLRKHGLDFARDLGRRNAQDLSAIIEWNEANQIRFFRISSEMFPFASHKIHGYDLVYARAELKAAGDLARKYGHRLTAHPGQFTQLASPRPDVIDASVRELEYHCQMMRYMELDKDSVMIIHMGGVYGDKEGTLDRFRENYCTRLTDEMRARLVLENDEMCYSPDDLLPVCDELGIPLVLDYHHNWINPSKHPLPTLLPLVAATWTRKGIRQKQHLSEPRPGAETVMEKRAHADRCQALPDVLEGGEVDLMIEAKDKEQAVLHLYRIYGLERVIRENLRPEKPPKPFVRGKGRVAAAEGEGEDEDGGEGLDEGEGGDGAEPVEAEAEAEVARPKTRARRKVADGLIKADSAADEGASVPHAKSIRPPKPKPKPKRRRTATNVVASDAHCAGDSNPDGPAAMITTPIQVDTSLMASSWPPSSSSSSSSSQTRRKRSSESSSPLARKRRNAGALLNQEDVVVPVDGACVADVEADEHPEAAWAAETVEEEVRRCKGGV